MSSSTHGTSDQQNAAANESASIIGGTDLDGIQDNLPNATPVENATESPNRPPAEQSTREAANRQRQVAESQVSTTRDLPPVNLNRRRRTTDPRILEMLEELDAAVEADNVSTDPSISFWDRIPDRTVIPSAMITDENGNESVAEYDPETGEVVNEITDVPTFDNPTEEDAERIVQNYIDRHRQQNVSDFPSTGVVNTMVEPEPEPEPVQEQATEQPEQDQNVISQIPDRQVGDIEGMTNEEYEAQREQIEADRQRAQGYRPTRREQDRMSDREIIETVVWNNNRLAAVDWANEFPDYPGDYSNRYMTEEEYQAAFEAGTMDFTQFGATQHEQIRAKMWRAIDNIVDELRTGYFHIRGESWNRDEERIEYSDPRIEDSIVRTLGYFGLDPANHERLVFRLVRLYMALSIDRQGQMINEDPDNFEMSPDDFVEVCDMIVTSCERYGHPLAIVSSGYSKYGSIRYPIGYLPKTMAEEITSAPYSQFMQNNDGLTAQELQERVMSEWNNRTRPEMYENLVGEKAAQMNVVLDMLRAVTRLDGITASRYHGITDEDVYTMAEYEDENAEYVHAFYGNYYSDQVREENEERVKRAVASNKLRKSGRVVYEDENTRIRQAKSQVTQFLDWLCVTRRGNGVFLNPAIWISSWPEHGRGIMLNKVAMKWSSRLVDRDRMDQFEMSEKIRAMAISDEGVDGSKAMKCLYDAGGMDALVAFRAEGKPMTSENVLAFLNENIYADTNAPQWAKKAKNWVDRHVNRLMPGDIGWSKQDSIVWWQAYLLSNAILAQEQNNHYASNGPVRAGGNKPAYTTREIERMLDAYNGVSNFLTQASATSAGISAFTYMRSGTIAQVTPLGHLLQTFLNRHSVTNAAITFFINAFPVYGVNFMQSFIPFSKTISYLAVRGFTLKNGRFVKEGSALNNLAEYQLGGELIAEGPVLQDPGFRMNVMWDCTMLGSNVLIAMFLFGLTQLLGGLDDPDDEANKYNISAYKIGGVEIHLTWWMNDLLLFGYPLAAVACVGVKHPEDPGLCWNLFLDACAEMASGTAIIDAVEVVLGFRDRYNEWQDAIRSEDYEGITDLPSYALLEAELFLGRASAGLLPMFPQTAWYRDTFFTGEDARMPDPSKVYDMSSEWAIENGITKTTSYEDQARRRVGMQSMLYALWNDLTKRVLPGKTEEVTGYLPNEMPASTKTDQLGLVWADKYAMDFANIPEEFKGNEAAYRWWMAEQVLTDIRGFTDLGMGPERAAMQGYVITKDARMSLLDYCWSMIMALDNEYATRLSTGELDDYDIGTQARVDWKAQKQYYYDIISDWCKNSIIPEWPGKYEKLLTDYDVIFVDRDTGQPVPSYMYVWPTTEKRYVNKGNHPTSFLPFTVVDTEDRGYNAETIPYWYTEGESGTDVNQIREGIGKETITMGAEEGQVLNDVIFAGDGEGNYATDQPTINARSYVYEAEPLSQEIYDFDEKDATGLTLGELGKYSKQAQDYINGGHSYTNKIPSFGRKTSYGGGSAYNPKIYSNPRSISADRAASMYTKQPYSASTNYLRPGFSTKGSREAYRRQDI